MLFQTDMQLVVCCGVGRIAVAVHYIADCTGGALAHAQAAVGALLRIDGGNIVVDSDRAGGAALLALAAGNTAHAAGLTGYSTLGLGRAAYIDLAGLGDHGDQTLGAGLGTCTAGDAVLRIYHSHTVHNVDGVILTGSYTVTKTDAAEVAGTTAAEHGVAGSAGLGSFVINGILGVLAGTIAVYYRMLGSSSFKGYTHDLTDLLGNRCTADRAEVGGKIRIGDQVCGIVVSTGKAAAAAVCTGQALTDLGGPLIYFHRKELGSSSQDHTSQQTNTAYQHYRKCINTHGSKLLSTKIT